MDLRDVIKLRRQHEQQFAQEQVVTNGRIVARNGTAKVPGVLNYVWVSPSLEEEDGDLLAEPVAVYNRTVKVRVGLAVQVGFAPYSSVLEILRTIVDTSNQTEDTSGINLEPHAGSHRVDGDDPLYIEERAFMSLLTYPTGTGMSVHVSSYGYWDEAGDWQVFDGQRDLDLSSHVPVSGSRLVLISLDKSTNTLTVTNGNVFVTDTLATLPDAPSLPAGHAPSAFVYLGATSMVRVLWPHIFNARDFLGRFAAHKLLSSAHSDTVIGDVVAGDLIYGNSTPGWARLAKGTDDQVLTLVSGLPAWADPTGGGNVWPKPGKLMIGEVEYDTLPDAIAAASSGDTIIGGVGTFACDDLTLPSGVHLVGGARTPTVFATSTEDTALTTVGGNYLANVVIQNTKVLDVNPPIALNVEGAIELFNVRTYATDADSRSLYLDTGSSGRIKDSDIEGNDIGIYVASTNTVIIMNMLVIAFGDGLYSEGNGTVRLFDTWFGAGQPDAGNLGGVNGWYFDASGDLIFLSGTGISGEVWRTPANGLQIKQGNLPGAIVAAADDDHIKLHAGEYAFTSSQEITTDLTIEGDGPEVTTILVDIDGGVAFNLDANDKTLTFRNLTILGDGDGTYAGLLFTDNSGAKIILDNCIVLKNAGTPTNGYGAWLEAGTLELRNGSKLLSLAGTNQYGIINLSTAANVIVNAGCEVGGTTQDIYGTVGGSTLDLRGPLLTNSLLDWAGTKKGHYKTAGGVLYSLNNITQSEGADVYPDGDINGLWNRKVNMTRTPIEHWHQNADVISWPGGWAGYTGFVTPDTLQYSGSTFAFRHSSTGKKFRFRAYINAQAILYCRVAADPGQQAGVMVDDGVGNADGNGANNFIRWMVEVPGSGNWNLAVERRTGGGAVTKTTYLSLPPAEFYTLALLYGSGTRWTNWTAVWYVMGESSLYAFSSQGSVASQSWTPARIGLYGASGTNLRSIFDWYHET